VLPHILGKPYPGGVNPVAMIERAVPSVALVLVAILMLFIMLGMFGFNKFTLAGRWSGAFALIFSVLAIAFIFARAGGWFGGASGNLPPLLQWLEPALNNPDLIAFLVTLLVFGLIVVYITSTPPEGDRPSFLERVGESLKALSSEENMGFDQVE
jgi:hypothetical protein